MLLPPLFHVAYITKSKKASQDLSYLWGAAGPGTGVVDLIGPIRAGRFCPASIGGRSGGGPQG